MSGRGRVWAAGAVLAAAVLAGALAVGAVPLSLDRIAGGLSGADAEAAALLALRAPRVALAALVGASLALAGVELQALFENPLVEPSLLGVGSGSALGTALFLAGSSSLASAPLLRAVGGQGAAFLGGLLAVSAVAAFGGAFRGGSPGRLILAGVAVNATAGALTGLLLAFADDSTLRAFTFWSLGSFAGARGSGVAAAAAVFLVGLLGAARRARWLDLLLFGPREAALAGVPVAALRRAIFGRVALVTGVTVPLVGVIGFVGLAAPHLARPLVGPGHRALLPASALVGAVLLVAADAVARVAIRPAELPLGLVTGLLGAPFFLVLLGRTRGLGR